MIFIEKNSSCPIATQLDRKHKNTKSIKNKKYINIIFIDKNSSCPIATPHSWNAENRYFLFLVLKHLVEYGLV